MKNLNITVGGDILCKADNIKVPALRAIEKYNQHPSIVAMAGISKKIFFFLIILQKISS